MGHIQAKEVHSPKAHWHLFEVIIEGKADEPSYALGTWDGDRRVGFRWNGNTERPIGNPQSRGLPTWTMLDPKLHKAVIELLSDDQQKQSVAKAYLGIQ